MGFLDYWRNRPQAEVQGNLLQPEGEGDAVVDRREPSRLSSYHRLHDEMKDRGAVPRTHRVANLLQNQELLGEDFEELYKELGVAIGDRVNLPLEAKQALMIGDIAAFEQIMEDNAQGHYQLIKSSQEGFKKARKLFRW